MIKRTAGAVLDGIAAHRVSIEVHVHSTGLPRFDLVGLADKAVRESRVRIRSALTESGIQFPTALSINLGPGRLPKEGTGLDLPLAVAIAAAVGDVDWPSLGDHILVAELGLDGRLVPVTGVLPIALECRAWGAAGLIVAEGNATEAAAVGGLAVRPAATLGQVLGHLAGRAPLPVAAGPVASAERPPPSVALGEIRGQLLAKRAVLLAAAGGHNLLLVGPPGAGKTMLARSLPGLLPPLDPEASLEVSRVHSVVGLLEGGRGIVTRPPFRAPHHTISREGLVGGGSSPRPGEVALAHRGVLFLDEMPEFERGALEALRQPLEEGAVRIVRAARSVRFPARFLLVGAMNPCRCGRYFVPGACRCTSHEVHRYLGKVSGPLLDRIDLQVCVDAVAFDELNAAEEPADDVAGFVEAARRLQSDRYGAGRTNGQASGARIRKVVALDRAGRRLLANAMSEFGLSARAHDRILKVARTIADLAGLETVGDAQILEALQYRKLDQALI